MGGPEVERLIGLLAKLPGLGPRSARRAALRLLQQPEARMLPLAAALAEAARAVRPCRAVRQPRQPRPLHDLRRPAPRPRADLRGRGRRRSVGAGARACASRPVSRARRHAVGAGRHRAGGSQSSPRCSRAWREGGVAEVILALGATVDGATTAHWLTDRLQPLGRGGQPGRRRACRSAARWMCWTTARWRPRCGRGGRFKRDDGRRPDGTGAPGPNIAAYEINRMRRMAMEHRHD